MTPPPALRIQSLSYVYPDGTRALDRVSLSIAEGETVGILGPNGAGKSTLLLHLNGLLLGHGAIEVFGLSVEKRNLKAIRQQVGLVFQNPDDQLFCPTVFDDVAFGPRNQGRPEEEVRRQVERSLAAVGLAGVEAKSAFHLSMGQKKRLAVATVLAAEARILALDEPTNSLDPRGRKEMARLLGQLGQTQVIVTHDLTLARATCDRIIVLLGGRVAADGITEEILSDHARLEEWQLE